MSTDNTEIANKWKTEADEAYALLKEQSERRETITNRIIQTQQEAAQLNSAITKAENEGDTEKVKQLQEDGRQLRAEQKSLRAERATLDEQIGQTQDRAVAARREYNAAIAGPAEASSTTPPVAEPTPTTPNPDQTTVAQAFPVPDRTVIREDSTLTDGSDPNATFQAQQSQYGLAYDDEGNLLPGWEIDAATGFPVYVAESTTPPKEQKEINPDESPAEAQRLQRQNDELQAAQIQAKKNTETSSVGSRGLQPKTSAQRQATSQDQNNQKQQSDWRLRLTLADKADYLYKVKPADAGILAPLIERGVIFPYTPQISMSYQAHYDGVDLAHTNYKFYQYKNSEVGQISITADFTAQDTEEASYVRAVMHFFKSATKMFYGQDSNPKNGTPPPICYLTGYGEYFFDKHPVVIANFSYTLPNDVDYIRAGSVTTYAGQPLAPFAEAKNANKFIPGISAVLGRLGGSNLKFGGLTGEPKFNYLPNTEATYIPTKLQIQLTLLPMITRKDLSDNFSLRDYANGKLLRGSKRSGGGIW